MNSLWRKGHKLYSITVSNGVPISRCCFSSTAVRNTDFPPNSSLQPIFVHNRNPRNLEKLRIGDKPIGWTIEKKGRSFWNKVTFEISGKSITGKILHHKGKCVVIASTVEWCIQKFLFSKKDTPAAEAVGKVLAQRCLQAGITEVASFYSEQDMKKEKIAVFLQALEKGGVALLEPEQFQPPIALNTPLLQEKGWEVFEEIPEDVQLGLKNTKN